MLKRLEEEDLDEGVRKRLKDSSETPGALWHIYLNQDMDIVREFLHKVGAQLKRLKNCVFFFSHSLLFSLPALSALQGAEFEPAVGQGSTQRPRIVLSEQEAAPEAAG